MRAWISIALSLAAAGASAAEWCHLVGHLGKPDRRIDVVLRIDGPKVSGNYLYAHVGIPIALTGTLSADGALKLQEKDGELSGKLTKGCTEFTGAWRGTGKAAQSRKVALTRAKKDALFGRGGIWVAREVKTATAEKSLLEVYGEDAAAEPLNSWLRRTADASCSGEECGSLTVSRGLENKDFVAVAFSVIGSTNWALGINQYRSTDWKVYSLADKAEVKLAEWLEPGALPALRKLALPRLREEIARNGAPAPPDEEVAKALKEFQLRESSLGLESKGLAIVAYYNPDGSISGSGTGNLALEISVTLPYGEIKPQVRPGTPLGKAIGAP